MDLVTLCIGGGQGITTIIENCSILTNNDIVKRRYSYVEFFIHRRTRAIPERFYETLPKKSCFHNIRNGIGKNRPSPSLEKLGDLGVNGLRIPEEYGGSGADCVTTGIAAEEIGRGDFNLTYAVMLNALVGEIIVQTWQVSDLRRMVTSNCKWRKNRRHSHYRTFCWYRCWWHSIYS